jgi:hypothetical protein
MSRAVIEELRRVREQLVEIDARCTERRALIQRLKVERADTSVALTRLRQEERERADLCDHLLVLEGRLDQRP